LLLAQNKYGETALHMAAECSVVVLGKIWVYLFINLSFFVKGSHLNEHELNNELLVAEV
jgi:hypothetical protein